jgi:hypothetical protein
MEPTNCDYYFKNGVYNSKTGTLLSKVPVLKSSSTFDYDYIQSNLEDKTPERVNHFTNSLTF